MGRKNIIAALMLIVFGVFYGYLSAHLPKRTLPNSPDPSFFPLILTALLLLLSFALLYQGFKNLPKASAVKEGRKIPFRPTAGVGLFMIYIAVLPWLGFLLASIPFFAGMLVIFGERRKWLWIIFAVGIPLFLFFLFRNLFQIPLPRMELFD